MKISWIPPSGEPPVTLTAEPYGVRRIAGLSHIPIAPRSERGPGQMGETAVDVFITGRVIDMTVSVSGDTDEEQWENRSALARAFVALPTVDDAETGIFRIERGGALPVLEVAAVPRRTPDESDFHPRHVYCDIELFCPDPFFREITDTNVRLETAGGFTFPLVHPFEMTAFNVEAELNNLGDIPVPIRARLHGEVTTPRLDNVTTGEAIEITGAIAAGDFIEINTGFGQKAITLVRADGTRENVMNRLNLAVADFFRLRRGTNLLRFSAATNTSGRAIVDWRQQYAGL